MRLSWPRPAIAACRVKSCLADVLARSPLPTYRLVAVKYLFMYLARALLLQAIFIYAHGDVSIGPFAGALLGPVQLLQLLAPVPSFARQLCSSGA